MKSRPSRVRNSRNATLRVHVLYFDLNSWLKNAGEFLGMKGRISVQGIVNVRADLTRR